MRVSIKLDQANIKKMEQAAMEALPLTLEAMKSEVNTMQVVPKDTGNLEESVSTGVEENKGYISYNTPYARRLYYHPEFSFRTDKNPHAKGRWMDDFIYGDKKYWLSKTFGKFLKDKAGGVIK